MEWQLDSKIKGMGNVKKGANEVKICREWRKGDGEWIYKKIFFPNIESFVCTEKLLPTIEKLCIYKCVNKNMEELCSPKMLVVFTTWHGVTFQKTCIISNTAVTALSLANWVTFVMNLEQIYVVFGTIWFRIFVFLFVYLRKTYKTILCTVVNSYKYLCFSSLCQRISGAVSWNFITRTPANIYFMQRSHVWCIWQNRH